MGLLHEVVAPADLEQRVLDLAQELLAIPFTALRHTKYQIDHALEQDIAALTATMVAAQEECLRSAEHAEVMETYREAQKRRARGI